MALDSLWSFGGRSARGTPSDRDPVTLEILVLDFRGQLRLTRLRGVG